MSQKLATKEYVDNLDVKNLKFYNADIVTGSMIINPAGKAFYVTGIPYENKVWIVSNGDGAANKDHYPTGTMEYNGMLAILFDAGFSGGMRINYIGIRAY